MGHLGGFYDSGSQNHGRNHLAYHSHDPIRWLFSADIAGQSGSHYMDNPLRQNFFRAGHAHAGVFAILSLVCRFWQTARRYPNR
jgi:hypothetical protein